MSPVSLSFVCEKNTPVRPWAPSQITDSLPSSFFSFLFHTFHSHFTVPDHQSGRSLYCCTVIPIVTGWEKEGDRKNRNNLTTPERVEKCRRGEQLDCIYACYEKFSLLFVNQERIPHVESSSNFDFIFVEFQFLDRNFSLLHVVARRRLVELWRKSLEMMLPRKKLFRHSTTYF